MLRDEIKRSSEESGIGQNNNYFQFKTSGKWRLRILTNPVAMATHFFGQGKGASVCYGMEKGCPFHGEEAPKDDKGNEKRASLKFSCYIIDREDGKIKFAELPLSVVMRIADFEEDEDFKFNGYPMPYDIKVTFDKENKDPKSMYKTEASPKQEPITVEEENTLAESMSKLNPVDFVQKRKEKQLEEHKNNGIWDKANEARANRLRSQKDVSGKDEDGVEYPKEDLGEIPF